MHEPDTTHDSDAVLICAVMCLTYAFFATQSLRGFDLFTMMLQCGYMFCIYSLSVLSPTHAWLQWPSVQLAHLVLFGPLGGFFEMTMLARTSFLVVGMADILEPVHWSLRTVSALAIALCATVPVGDLDPDALSTLILIVIAMLAPRGIRMLFVNIGIFVFLFANTATPKGLHGNLRVGTVDLGDLGNLGDLGAGTVDCANCT